MKISSLANVYDGNTLNASNNKTVFFDIAFYSFVFLFSFFAPFFSFVCFCLLVVYSGDYKFIKAIPISLTFFFILINFNRDFFQIGNDLVWYYSYFKNFAEYEYGFIEAFGHNDLATVPLKITEPVYHLIIYALSKMTNGYYPLFILLIHFCVYLIPTFVIINICKLERVSVYLCMSLVLFQMLVFYDFGNAYNLIRQQVASSFVVLSFYFMCRNNFKLCFIFCLVSVFTHNSTALIAALIFLFLLYNLNFVSYKMVLFFSVLLSFIYVLLYFKFSGNYEDLEDQARGVIVKSIDFTLFLFALSIVSFFESKYRELFKFVFIFFIALLFSHLSDFLPLRFFTFYDSFKWLVYFILIDFILTKFSAYKNIGFFVLSISFCLAFLYFNLKLTYTAYSYNGTFTDFAFDSLLFYLGTNL